MSELFDEKMENNLAKQSPSENFNNVSPWASSHMENIRNSIMHGGGDQDMCDDYLETLNPKSRNNELWNERIRANNYLNQR